MSNHRMTSWLKVSCCNSIIIFNLNARYMLRFRKFILSYWSRAVINRLGCCKHSFIMINLLENIIFFKFTIPFSMLHFFVFQTLSVTNLTLSSNDMTYGICTWMQAIVSNHLKQKRKFMLKIHTRLHKSMWNQSLDFFLCRALNMTTFCSYV